MKRSDRESDDGGLLDNGHTDIGCHSLRHSSARHSGRFTRTATPQSATPTRVVPVSWSLGSSAHKRDDSSVFLVYLKTSTHVAVYSSSRATPFSSQSLRNLNIFVHSFGRCRACTAPYSQVSCLHCAIRVGRPPNTTGVGLWTTPPVAAHDRRGTLCCEKQRQVGAISIGCHLLTGTCFGGCVACNQTSLEATLRATRLACTHTCIHARMHTFCFSALLSAVVLLSQVLTMKNAPRLL
jgi:hypothetical protein